MVHSRTIVHNHLQETQPCFQWYTCTKIITRWKCSLCTVTINYQLTWCYTDVTNTVLVLAVWLLNVNQLLCPEWVGEWHSATFSTVREHELRPHSSLCESRQFHSPPACSRLSSNELRKERISSWSDFVCWKSWCQTPQSMTMTMTMLQQVRAVQGYPHNIKVICFRFTEGKAPKKQKYGPRSLQS